MGSAFLKSVPSFANLQEETLIKIADVLEETTYKSGEYIVRQGAGGDTFFIIKRGRVKVTKKEENDKEEKFIETSIKETFLEKKLCKERKKGLPILLPMMKMALFAW